MVSSATLTTMTLGETLPRTELDDPLAKLPHGYDELLGR
jgi:hypothetical protein